MFFCGCFTSSDPKPSQAQTQTPYDSQAGSFQRDGQDTPPQYSSAALAETDAYVAVVPLPRYTPRVVSIHEKTLESSSNQDQFGTTTPHNPDEKNRNDFEEPSTSSENNTADDASSAYSFPSSFGHTSTDTRDTPPPPYASSLALSRSRASSMNYRVGISITSHPMQNPPSITPPPMAHIHQPQPMFRQSISISSRAAVYPEAFEHFHSHQPRRSWESR